MNKQGISLRGVGATGSFRRHRGLSPVKLFQRGDVLSPVAYWPLTETDCTNNNRDVCRDQSGQRASGGQWLL